MGEQADNFIQEYFPRPGQQEFSVACYHVIKGANSELDMTKDVVHLMGTGGVATGNPVSACVEFYRRWKSAIDKVLDVPETRAVILLVKRFFSVGDRGLKLLGDIELKHVIIK